MGGLAALFDRRGTSSVTSKKNAGLPLQSAMQSGLRGERLVLGETSVVGK
jgi:hypothetical protein